jgi:endonuclease YncB( thermonuclease family)
LNHLKIAVGDFTVAQSSKSAMVFRYCIASFTVAMLLSVSVATASAQKAPSAKPFERFDGCVLTPDEWTDGDSFRVRLPDGRLETFRLYFVDTTESRSRGKRSDEQAAYFGLTRADAIKLGEEAKAFTAAALQRPFTIQTRWRKVFGPTRYYACVFTAGGNDLAELLVINGLARIYGTRTPLPDGRDSRTYLATLRDLENQAKSARVGGWRR